MPEQRVVCAGDNKHGSDRCVGVMFDYVSNIELSPQSHMSTGGDK